MKFLFLLSALAVVAADPSKSIVENAVATPSLSTLVKVLTMKEYKPVLDALSGPGPFTVFAPNNDAFAASHVDPKYVEVVTQVLMYHVLSGTVKSTDLAALQFPNTLMTEKKFVALGGKGQVLGVAKTDKGVTINFGIPGVGNLTANVVVADVICTNGVVHIIDRVMFFPEDVARVAEHAGLKEVVKALVKAGLVPAVEKTSSLTIFAPTNEAMIAAKWETLDMATLKAVLELHVVPAVAYSTDLKDGEVVPTLNGQNLTITTTGGVKVNGANVVVANALVRNGVVHVIDKVLLPQ